MNIQPQIVNWSKEPPDRPGWYWWCLTPNGPKTIEWIYSYGPEMKVHDETERLCGQQLTVAEQGGWWAGPLEPPPPPPEPETKP